ncbi:MAG: flagellar filament capping protein FliD [Firmicutes bacterium]|nr:flagellar filament capping protein FliD [Bacillota bacterium]
MGMTSLGVGSGLELDAMVRQLVALERAPRIERIETREKAADANISALGQLKSAMSSLKTSISDLTSERSMNSRVASVSGQPEDNPFFTASASPSAASSNYNIEISQLASGSRMQSASFGNATDAVAGGNGTMTFSAGDKSFDVEIEDGASLQDIANAINRSSDNYGVSASIINTGTESFLVFDSPTSGAGNDLSVTATGLTGIDGLTDGNLTTQREARDAIMSVDGIEVRSSTNTFENAIQGVSVEAKRVTTGTDFTPRLEVDIDRDGVREKIDGFIKTYNSLIDELDKLTAYAPDGKSGPLIGDSMVRSIRSQMSSILGNQVAGASDSMNSLFQLGITTTKEGKLEFDSRNIGGGTGEQRFDQALTQNFDDVVALFSGENGLATRMDSVIDQYTRSQGLIDGRTNVFENQKSMADNERVQFERYMEQYEANLRQRFGALDQNIARMSSNASMLFQYI